MFYGLHKVILQNLLIKNNNNTNNEFIGEIKRSRLVSSQSSAKQGPYIISKIFYRYLTEEGLKKLITELQTEDIAKLVAEAKDVSYFTIYILRKPTK